MNTNSSNPITARLPAGYVDIAGDGASELSVMPNDVEATQQSLVVVEAARRAGRIDLAATGLRVVEEACVRHRWTGMLGWTLWVKANGLRQTGHEGHEYDALLTQARQLSRDAGDVELHLMVLAAQAESDRIHGHYSVAWASHEMLLQEFLSRGHLRGQVWALQGLGQMMKKTNQPLVADEYFSDGLERSMTTGDLKDIGYSWKGKAEALLDRGKPDDAQAMLEVADHCFVQLQSPIGRGFVMLGMADCLLMKGDWQAAQAKAQLARTHLQSAKSRRGVLFSDLRLGAVLLAARNLSAARNVIRSAYRGFTALGNETGKRDAAALLARC